MPEEKPEITSQEDASTQDGSAPNTDNAEESLFDNMTSEELKAALVEKDKGYKELHGKMGQMSGELGELRSFRKESEGDAKLADTLSAVKDMVAEKNKEPERDYEAFEAEIIAEAQENPGEAMKRFMRANSSWSAQDKQALQSQHEKEMAEIKAQVGVLADAYQTTTDDYKENKELIEKFRSKGMSIADAKAMAKDVREMIPVERTTPPSGIDPTRTIVPDSKKQTEARYSAEEIADMKARLPDDVVDALIEKANRDSNLTDKEKEDF